MKKKLIWVGPEFTPYHEFFLDCLANDPRFELHVEMINGPSKTHPFRSGTAKPYSWRISSQLSPHEQSVVERVLSQPDAAVVVASYVDPILLEVMSALVRRGRPFIYFTDTPLPQDQRWEGDAMQPRSLARRVGRWLRLRWIFRNARYVFATGMVGVDAVIALGCPREKAVVFPFFVPLLGYDLAAKEGSTMQFASVGQLIKRKGLDVALDAFERNQLVLKDRDWNWDIIGDGPQRAELEQRVQQSPLAHRIAFRGWLQSDEIQGVLRSTHVFLHPARWDPFPVSVLEAMSAGLAVLGSDRSGSVVDRVRDGINGFIHRAEDVSALALHIAAVTENTSRTREMCQKSREIAEAWPVERGVDILASRLM